MAQAIWVIFRSRHKDDFIAETEKQIETRDRAVRRKALELAIAIIDEEGDSTDFAKDRIQQLIDKESSSEREESQT